MERLTFRMGDAFPADEAIAVWAMNISIALGDLRIIAPYATREEQPVHERIYFVRVFAAHLREISKLLVLDYSDREDVRQFVATLPQGGQDAREAAQQLLDSVFPSRPDVEVWRDVKRLRDDTFHYARDEESRARLMAAMESVADFEGAYVLDESHGLRAEFADLVTANRMHPFNEDPTLPVTRELHETIVALNGHVATFLAAVEATYLLETVEDGLVTHHPE